MAGTFKNPFDFEGGDLTIIVMYEGERVTGKVSASAMMLASPVWKKFICPPWTPLPATDEEETNGETQKEQDLGGVNMAAVMVKSDDKDEEPPSSKVTKKQRTSQTSTSKELDFTEDDGEAFLILLRIAHLHFLKLPVQGLSLDLLLQLATVSDKYDCIYLVKPWISQWALDPDIKMKDLEKLLFVAWAFRPEGEMWSKVPLRVVEMLYVDDLGVHQFSGDSSESGRIVALDQMPPGLIERLLSKRQEVMEEIFEIAYCDLNNIPAVGCEYGGGEDNCVNARYGSLSLGLRYCAVWPPSRDTMDLSESLKDVEKDLTELPKRLDGHEYCGVEGWGRTLSERISDFIDNATFDFDSLPTE
ncbi:hypothetical protein LOCC1_G001344 [Lachnellula occidentalis]|uniref:BTB domain-containing protein n=1 Tax=Lachnellula occidentalis TaxID=215460 RepID=A0A8H8S677_9HELO|nr:hypothetical protein LOCC1_G001344 [Lachnellula occidentalis]